MIGKIYHIGLTVSNLDRSVAFYRDVLGLEYQGEILMEGKETDALFCRENCTARVAYLNGSPTVDAPPIELIQFVDSEIVRAQPNLFTTSISEVCLQTDDIDSAYRHLIDHGVKCLSAPQDFDFSKHGFGKSKALYFLDPDGIVLELMQPIS